MPPTRVLRRSSERRGEKQIGCDLSLEGVHPIGKGALTLATTSH